MSARTLKLLIPIEEAIPAAIAESPKALTNPFRMIQPRIVLELLKKTRRLIRAHRDCAFDSTVASENARTLPKKGAGKTLKGLSLETHGGTFGESDRWKLSMLPQI
jgi:hypothetical protein